jgi:putative membrane-bound dehydrogenase-like protein
MGYDGVCPSFWSAAMSLGFRFLPLLVLVSASALAADGNRLAYLDGPLDPYYPHREFPKLITPQWVGEEGVECVVTLAIDDMRDTAKYEAYLRPILDRLKKIDGRAPVSIMSCRVDPADPQLQAWLKEGLSIEVHTFDHPCPCLQDGGLVQAKATYDKCVDLMHEIPGNKPVAFRMPCCDSKNTPSPRFWAEVFNKTTAKGNFLQIDSSVFNIITKDDKDLPKEITQLPDGSSRYERYVPFPNFVNTIRDYPYPYVIGGMCWEFPCVVPSDWSAQHVQKPNNPDTVRDWKLALDACVLKQGTFNLVFHPHGWIRNDQIVELIDHAVTKHGKKVKFLTFKECAERLNRHLLNGNSIRAAGQRNPNILVSYDHNYAFVRQHHKDVVIDRNWQSATHDWRSTQTTDPSTGLALHNAAGWLRDIDGDGLPGEDVLFGDGPNPVRTVFSSKAFTLPMHVKFSRQDAGLRLIDVNADGKLDCLFSNHERYSLHLFKDMKEGWAIKVFDVERGKEEASGAPVIPPFVRADGTNNGTFFHSGALWFVNEDTWRMPDHVQKFTFAELLAPLNAGDDNKQASGRREAPGKVAPPKSPQSKPAPSPPAPLPQGEGGAVAPSSETPPPKSPDEALKSMHLKPGFKIELVASEPLVVDPVAFDWGPDGRLWVVEMRDYPNGLTWKQAGDEIGVPGGRVKVLTDENGDGKYDKASIFLDDIPFPTGVKVWRKGILVTAAPDVFYAEDTNGDDVADERKILYRGFGEGNQQHRVNGLRWGLDNWLYIGNGDSGGVIKSMGALIPLPKGEGGIDAEINVNGRDLRIRPDTGEIDAQSGQTQFGRERDDWGNWFGGNNSNPMWHYPLEDHYLRRNPHFAPPATRKQVSISPGAAPVFPKSKTLARFNDFHTADRFTSACSPIIYRDELLGPDFYGNSFVCEPVHNLVHREIVSPDGLTFTSRRPDDEQQSEFLASDDNWFRPSMCRTGPDGALWVSDMYRFVIEHPKWIPEEAQARLDLRAGEDKGRIYRIYHESRPPQPIARLDKLDTAGLVQAIDSPNGQQRDLVQQLLIWRGDKAAAEPLRKLALEAERPQVRLQALCTLDGLGELTPEIVNLAMHDKHAAVVCHAVRLSEPWLAKSEYLQNNVLANVYHDDPRVRMQAAYSLGTWNDPRAVAALARLLADGAAGEYLSAAAMSSVNQDSVGPVLSRVLNLKKGEPPAELVQKLLAVAIALKSDSAVREAMDEVLSSEGKLQLWQLAAVGSLLDALDKRRLRVADLVGGSAKEALQSLFAQARTIAAGKGSAPKNEPAWRLAAIRLLGRGLDQQSDDAALLVELLVPQQPADVQAAAVTALEKLQRPELPQSLLGGWRSHTPALRQQILDVLLSRADWSAALLDAVERSEVAGSQLDARRRSQLLATNDRTLRQRAEKLLAGDVDPNRQQVVEQYSRASLKAVLEGETDAARGKAVFAKRCANCHKLDGVGYAIGPDLAALTNRSREALLTAIFDPNRAVEDKFLEYVVRLIDGRQVNGLLLEETGASLTLAAPDGKQTVVPRSEVDELRSSGKSLMPEGVEKDITPAEAADLIAYLAGSGPQPKSFAGNSPEVVQPFVDGSISLLATNARIYGPTVVLEEKYRNLGWWSSLEDHAAWSFAVPASAGGEYRVTLDYACDNGAAGNTARVQISGQSLTFKVEGTGTWDEYRGKEIGKVSLAAGHGELLVQSDGQIKGALFDLRSVRLVPVKP